MFPKLNFMALLSNYFYFFIYLLSILILTSNGQSISLDQFRKILENMNIQQIQADIKLLNYLNQPVLTNISYLETAIYETNFHDYNCHFTINNYNNINLKFETYPGIVRRPELALLGQTLSSLQELSQIGRMLSLRQPYSWIPFGHQTKTEKRYTRKFENINCTKSKYLTDFEVHDSKLHSPDLCLRINLPTYSAQSKPWNCQVDLHLLPSPLIFPHAKYPLTFKIPVHSSSSEYFRMMLTSMRPHFTILVDWAELYDSKNIWKWLEYSKAEPPMDDATPYITYNEFVLIKMRHNLIKEQTILRTDFQGNLQLVKFNDGIIKQMENGKDEEWTGEWKFFAPNAYNTVRNVGLYHSSILHHLSHCGNDKEWGHINRAKYPVDKNVGFNNKLYLGITLTLLSVWKNYSYISDKEKQCRNGNERAVRLRLDLVALFSNQLVDPKGTHYYPLSFNDSLQSMKFVSCGASKGVEGVAFSEMYSIFDVWIWICLVVSACVVGANLSWTLNVARTDRNFCSRIWHSVKIYLEQSGPYADFVNGKSKPIVGTTLLVGIVLSNAYKNANVYNMILPRKVVPFTDVTELADHRFSVYTKPSYMKCPVVDCITHHLWHRTKYAGYGTMNCTLTQHRFRCQHSLWTRNGWMVVEVDSDLEYVSGVNSFNSKTKTGGHIKDTAKLIPLRDVYDGLVNDNPDRETNRAPTAVDNFKELALIGDFHLFKMLKSCNRTAAVVAEYWAKRYEQRLKRLNLKNVFVGKDKYLDANQGFHFRGKIHRNVAKRIEAIKYSGIWDWWPKHARDYFDFSGEQMESMTIPVPSMKGNIQVIFYVLAGGLNISVIVLIGESILQIVVFIKSGL